jgi:excisionase family DNA binding protein
LKFLKHNFLTLIVLVVLIVCVFKLNDLQAKYNNLSTQHLMMQSGIQNANDFIRNNSQQATPEKSSKGVMTPLELAKYMGIEMDVVYDIATSDPTMPYIQINGEFRFNKEAIDKWMETRRTIETK